MDSETPARRAAVSWATNSETPSQGLPAHHDRSRSSIPHQWGAPGARPQPFGAGAPYSCGREAFAVMPCPVSSQCAADAQAGPVPSPPRVRLREPVAADAARLPGLHSGEALAAQNVFTWSDRFEVQRIRAIGHPAQVVKLLPPRDLPHKQPVHQPVDTEREVISARADPDHAVPVRFRSGPPPAWRFKRPRNLRQVEQRTVSRAHLDVGHHG